MPWIKWSGHIVLFVVLYIFIGLNLSVCCHNFWTIWGRYFIFGICTHRPCDLDCDLYENLKTALQTFLSPGYSFSQTHLVMRIVLFTYFKHWLAKEIVMHKLKCLILFFVLAAPKFLAPEKMKRQLIKRPVDSSVRLKCRATGNPRPTITWLKDKQVIRNDDHHHHKPMWTLKLQDLKEGHSGKYTCLVSNRLGAINYTYTLDVIGKFYFRL